MRVTIFILCTIATRVFSISEVGATSQCIKVPSNLHFCRGDVHTEMMLPNWSNDKTTSELFLTSKHWLPLVSNGNMCHPHARKFLCSVITPICMKPKNMSMITGHPVAMYPCRSFCESVEKKCEPFMQRRYSSSWPLIYRCNRYPNENCYSPTNDTGNEMSKKCRFCGPQMQKKSLIEHLCQSSIVLIGFLGKNGMVVPYEKNLTSSVLFGLQKANNFVISVANHTNQTGPKTYFNISGACACKRDVVKPKAKSLQLAKGGDRNRSSYLIFVDIVKHLIHEELSSSLTIRLNSLTKEQNDQLHKIRSNSHTCNGSTVRAHRGLQKDSMKRSDYHRTGALKNNTIGQKAKKPSIAAKRMTTPAARRIKKTTRSRNAYA